GGLAFEQHGVCDQVIGPQHVVDVEARAREDFDPGQVAGGAAGELVVGDEEDALLTVDPVVLGPGYELPRLAPDSERLDERELAGVGAAGDRHLKAELPHALGQRVAVVARVRAEGRPTADKDGSLAAAVAGATGALLRPDLGRGAYDGPAGLGCRRAAATLGELPGDDLMKHGLLGFGQVERDLAVRADDGDRHCHQLAPLFDTRTSTSPPLGPGTAPFTIRRLSSGRTSITSRPSVVTRSLPY